MSFASRLASTGQRSNDSVKISPQRSHRRDLCTKRSFRNIPKVQPDGSRFRGETSVRKLLVASQKGGVGKTTTSMNLAAATAMSGSTRVLLLDADPLSNISTALKLYEHPRRQSLRSAGIDLPGTLVVNLVPGLDILSPYEEGFCSDTD